MVIINITFTVKKINNKKINKTCLIPNILMFVPIYRASTGKGVDKNPLPSPTLAFLAIFPELAPAAIIHIPKTICWVSPFAKLI
jgi:hypothetical protein